MVVVGQSYPGALPVAYEDVPEFDQATQYVIQQLPVDAGNHIFMGAEVKTMELDADEGGEVI